MNAGLRADDHVLFLAPPSEQELAAVARILAFGTVTVLGTTEEVAWARGRFADFNNVMLLDAGPDQIPARNGAFNKIFVAAQYERIFAHIVGELQRVLKVGGEIVRDGFTG